MQRGSTNVIANIYNAQIELSGWVYDDYTATNLPLLTNSVWSTNFWLKGVQGLSATSIGFTNGRAAQGSVTMISPRHCNNGVASPSGPQTGTVEPVKVADPGYEGGWICVGYEHCQMQDSVTASRTFSVNGGGTKLSQDKVVYSRKADTVMKLYTGGKAASKRQNLFRLSATDWEVPGMELRPNLLDDLTYGEWDMPPRWWPEADIDPTDIEVDGKNLGNDGQRI